MTIQPPRTIGTARHPREVIHRIEGWMVDAKRATYGLSFSRATVGVAVLGILLTNFSTRDVVWGPGSAWAQMSRDGSSFGTLSQLWATSSPALFTVQYLCLIGVAICVIVGWRTRLTAAALVIGMTALVERNPLVGDQGDNIARIGLIFLIVASSSEHWSVDARRRRRALDGGESTSLPRRLWAGLAVLPQPVGALVHNLALVALALQVFVLYLASALFKANGDLWQQGTALYYPLSLHEYAVFPWLNSLLISNGLILTAATYFAVFVQLFFAPLLLHPLTRRIAVLAVVAMHLGIAVLMGLPWFSLSMIAFDGIFVTAVTYRAIESRVQATIVRGATAANRRGVRSLAPGRSRSSPSSQSSSSSQSSPP